MAEYYQSEREHAQVEHFMPTQKRPIPIWPATKDRPLLPLSLGGLCYLSDIDDRDESFAIQKTLFLGFPSVLAGGRDAHYQAIGWCISRKAVIINRDVFSAGGQKIVSLAGTSLTLSLPGVMTKAITALQRVCPVSLADLSEIHGQRIRSAESAIELYESNLLNNGVMDELSAMVAQRGKLSLNVARQSLVATLISSINTEGFIR